MNQSNQPANHAPVTLINIFEMPTEHVEAFIAGWRERAALMSSKPGFLDARLHRAMSGSRHHPAQKQRLGSRSGHGSVRLWATS